MGLQYTSTLCLLIKNITSAILLQYLHIWKLHNRTHIIDITSIQNFTEIFKKYYYNIQIWTYNHIYIIDIRSMQFVLNVAGPKKNFKCNQRSIDYITKYQ